MVFHRHFTQRSLVLNHRGIRLRAQTEMRCTGKMRNFLEINFTLEGSYKSVGHRVHYVPFERRFFYNVAKRTFCLTTMVSQRRPPALSHITCVSSCCTYFYTYIICSLDNFCWNPDVRPFTINFSHVSHHDYDYDYDLDYDYDIH